MKKIDLHIHTISNSYLDSKFDFSSEFFKEYVIRNSLDVVAITNHNLFDENNFIIAKSMLEDNDCLLLPGIEISLENGHVLVIFDDTPTNIELLKNISDFIKKSENDNQYKMSVNDFNDLCCGHNAPVCRSNTRFLP